MQLNIELNKQDYSDFYRYYYFKKTLKNNIILYSIMTFTLPLLWKDNAFDLSIYIRDVLFCLVFFPLFHMLFTFLVHKTTILLSKKSSLFGTKTITLSDEGFTEASSNSSKQYTWEAVKSIDEDKKHLYVFVGKTGAHIIPKRNFKTIEEQDIFLYELRKYVNSKTA